MSSLIIFSFFPPIYYLINEPDPGEFIHERFIQNFTRFTFLFLFSSTPTGQFDVKTFTGMKARSNRAEPKTAKYSLPLMAAKYGPML